MFKSICRLMIVLMLWNTAGFAKRPGSKAAQTKDELQVEDRSAWLPDVDPSMIDYRTGRRIVRALDRPIDPAAYVIGPYDEFVLFIRGAEETKVRLRVLPEGTFVLPNVGALPVAGKTITEMRAMVVESLRPYYRNVEFDCQLVLPRTIIVYVLGEVERPGQVELFAPFRLDMALSGAGGVSDRGSNRAIEIHADGEVVERADFQKFLRVGDLSQNPALHEGLSVYVPSRRAACSVMGEVWRGGLYEVVEGETVADLVELAGGLTPTARTDHLVLERMGENSELTVSQFEWEDASTLSLRDRDVVVIPDRKTFPGTDFVRLYGGGGREGIVHIQQGETIASFLPRFVRLREDHDLSHAVIERNTESGDVRYIEVDLNAVIDGTLEDDIDLQSGDVISVPLFEEFVYVVGQVTLPGPIEFQRGMSAERYVALAGGPGTDGSIDRLEIISVEGDKRGGGRNSTVYRGETIIVKQKKSRIFQSVFISLTTLTSLVLSIVAVSRTN